jgi:hypothetical protein
MMPSPGCGASVSRTIARRRKTSRVWYMPASRFAVCSSNTGIPPWMQIC